MIGLKIKGLISGGEITTNEYHKRQPEAEKTLRRQPEANSNPDEFGGAGQAEVSFHQVLLSLQIKKVYENFA